MRRVGGWALALAIAAVAGAATVDALRRTEPADERSDAVPRSAALAEALRRDGISGRLVFETPDCRVRAVVLPTLTRADEPLPRTCGARLGAAVEPACGYGRADVIAASVAALWRLATSCVPWVPAALRARIGGRCPRMEVETVVRIAAGELAVAARCGSRSFVARFRAGRVVWTAPVPRRDIELRPSPGGRYVGAVIDDRALVVLDRGGRPIALPDRVAAAHSIAWSPDGRWTAAAAPTSVYLFRLGAHERATHELPLAAQNLAWHDP